MSDWDSVTRNLKRHGTFAGQSGAEQDAYFDYFSGATRAPGTRRLRWRRPRITLWDA